MGNTNRVLKGHKGIDRFLLQVREEYTTEKIIHQPTLHGVQSRDQFAESWQLYRFAYREYLPRILQKWKVLCLFGGFDSNGTPTHTTMSALVGRRLPNLCETDSRFHQHPSSFIQINFLFVVIGNSNTAHSL